MTGRRVLILAAFISSAPLPAMALDDASDHQLEDVVVTAQRRAQHFNEVGIAATEISGDDVATRGISQVSDIEKQAPNVEIKNAMSNGIPIITVRGIGLNDYAANNNPAAGIYVDEVYLTSPAMLSFGIFDIDRIEVLKGPQSTLYGRNTTAGAINFVSRKPTEELNAYATVDFGNYEYKRLEAAVGGGIAPGLSGRLALLTVQQGSGWQTNLLNGKKVGQIDREAIRGQLQWKPNDDVSVLLNVHGGYDGSDIWLLKVNNVFSGQTYNDPDPYHSGAGIDPHMNLKSQGVSVAVDWAISQELTLASVTDYEHFTREQVQDGDATALTQLDSWFNNRLEQYSQELRLTYETPKLVLTGGTYIGWDKVSTVDSYHADQLPGLAGVDVIGNKYTQKTRSAAVFLNSEWNFAPRWKLTTGLRYTKDDKDFYDATTFLVVGGAESFVFPPPSNQFSSHNVSGKVGLDYKLGEAGLLYASVSRGFKSGGFQGELTFNPEDLKPYRDERLQAYEVGFKSRLLANAMQLTAALFRYNYTDMQFYGALFNSPVGTLFGITNVGDSRVQGAEADLWWRMTSRLDFRLGAGALDTKVTHSIVDGVNEGSSLPDAPKFTFNSQIHYQWPVSQRLHADIMAAVNYQSRVVFDVIRNPPEAIEGGYLLTDARLGLGSDGGRWNVALWGRNLANRVYRTQALSSSVGWQYTYGVPRTYGISATLEF